MTTKAAPLADEVDTVKALRRINEAAGVNLADIKTVFQYLPALLDAFTENASLRAHIALLEARVKELDDALGSDTDWSAQLKACNDTLEADNKRLREALEFVDARSNLDPTDETAGAMRAVLIRDGLAQPAPPAQDGDK
jgi:DNA-binding transcriptional MerR regulator